jgi:CRP/FNR family transcriptional regulator, anaerobic regulatory protein
MRQINSDIRTRPADTPILAATGRGAAGASPFAAIGSIIQLGAKDTLIWEGDAADNIYQVMHGLACLYKLLPDGRRQVARFCHAGDLIGLTADRYYPYTADALTGLTVVRIRRADLENRIETDCALGKSVLNAIGQELSLAQNQLLLLGRKSASERVASFLQAMVEQAVRDGGDGRSVVLAMTRVDIADFLGLTHETVCRTFSLFRNQGIIAIPDPHLVEIRRPEVLEEIAEGDTPDRLCA